MSSLGKRKASSVMVTPLTRRKTRVYAPVPKRRLGTAAGSLNKAIKSALLSMSEKKYVYQSHAIIQLYHNSGSPASGRILPAPMTIDGQNSLPSQGAASNQRIGDSCIVKGVDLNLMFYQKLDRKNVTFRVIVTKSNSLATTINELITPSLLNVMLDYPDPERGVVFDKLVRRTIHPDLSGVGGADKEFSFVESFHFPINQKVNFTTSGAIAPDRKQLNVWVFAYDTFGTLLTDNIAYVSGSSRLTFVD